MPPILVTGAAGFIGFHTVRALVERGLTVIGLDNLNDYYLPTLKELRLDQLRHSAEGQRLFTFAHCGLEDKATLNELFNKYRFETVINLAAQAGVRYSLTNPDAYVQSNLVGFVNLLEACRHQGVGNLIFASSSSVYGLNSRMPFSEEDNVDHPISLYAATKKSNELMAHSYSHLFSLPTTGLRFFTVYGPWGRPDMAIHLFATAILEGRPLRLFRGGDMLRDFTFIDDVVQGIIRLVDLPALADSCWRGDAPTVCTSSAPYRIYNIGNNAPILVRDLLGKLEALLGRKANIVDEPIQPGDVPATFAAIDRLAAAVDFAPRTDIDTGLRRFVDWLLWYRQRTAAGNPKEEYHPSLENRDVQMDRA